MCNACPTNDLDDGLDDIFGPLEGRKVSDEDAEFVRSKLANAVHRPAGEAVYEEDCPKCKGSGRFIGYTGRVVGNCFHCKGAGKVRFKTSPEARAAKRESAAAKKDRETAELAEKVLAWTKTNKTEWDWMVAASGRGFAFASSMIEALAKYGYLTEKQMAAVHRCMAQDEQRDRERQEIAERAPDIKEAALDKIMDSFERAVAKDIVFPKMRLDTFLFSLVRKGANAGAIYVKTIERGDDGERRYLGKIVEGRFLRAYKCSPEEQERIVAAASDPEAAAIAYGRRMGACSICGRALTNHESIDRGIGPICAENFGW